MKTLTENLGPAFAGLTELQKRFVVCFVETGGKNATQAARMAGYSPGRTSRNMGSALLRDPRVIHAIQGHSKTVLGGLTAGAVLVQKGLLDNADPRVRQRAADSVFDRTGIGRQSSTHIRVENELADVPTAVLVRRVQDLQAQIAAEGRAPLVIEGELAGE